MSAVVFNPMDPAFVADPYSTYHRPLVSMPRTQNATAASAYQKAK